MKVVGISVDSVATTQLDLIPRIGEVPFPLLADPDGEVTLAWGLQQTGREIAVPATYIVDAEGKIRWARISAHYTERPSLDEVLEALDSRR